MFAHILRRVSILGWLRYWLFDRNAYQTALYCLIGICLLLSLASAVLLRDFNANAMTFAEAIKSFLPVLALAIITILLLMYRYMEATGLSIFMLTTLVNDGVSTGTDTKLTFTFLALIVWVFIWFFRSAVVDRSFKLRPSKANLPILIFSVIVLFAYVWSGAFPEDSAKYLFSQKSLVRLMTAVVLIISPLTYILFSNFIRSDRSFKLMAWWFIGFGFIAAILRLVFDQVPKPLNARGQFPTWVCALALGQILFNRNLNGVTRLILLIPVLLWCQISIGLGISWLSGWLPIVIVIGALVAMYSRKLLLFGLLLVVVWGVANIDFVTTTLTGEEDESGTGRTTAWVRTFDVVQKHLLFGAGPAGYEYYFQAYGYYKVGLGVAQLSHNNYIDIIAQTGLFGFATWVWMWLGQGWMIWKLFKKRIDDPFFSALRYSMVACYPAILVAMMLGDWVTPFPYTQGLAGIDYTIWAWMFSGMSVALYYWSPQLSRTQSSELPTLSAPASLRLAERSES